MRDCGDCQVCCEVMSVQALAKPANTPCMHQCKSGCAIYGKRPKECKSIRCGWLDGVGDEDQRPDKSGFMLYSTLVPNFGVQVIAVQSAPNTFQSEDVKIELMNIARQLNKVILMDFRNGRIDAIGPLDKLKEHQEIHAQHKNS